MEIILHNDSDKRSRAFHSPALSVRSDHVMKSESLFIYNISTFFST